jgi:hypothetical protein
MAARADIHETQETFGLGWGARAAAPLKVGSPFAIPPSALGHQITYDKIPDYGFLAANFKLESTSWTRFDDGEVLETRRYVPRLNPAESHLLNESELSALSIGYRTPNQRELHT